MTIYDNGKALDGRLHRIMKYACQIDRRVEMNERKIAELHKSLADVRDALRVFKEILLCRVIQQSKEKEQG